MRVWGWGGGELAKGGGVGLVVITPDVSQV